jgi:acyl-CoA synthetase (AMP-forming)/AMP-acid ligase II
MAETTFAVTQTPIDSRAKEFMADRNSLTRGIAAPCAGADSGRACVSSGRTIRGTEIKILDESGSQLADGRVGEIWIRSETMFSGYRNAPEETAKVLRDGWYQSGDLGFLLDGQLFVTGRKKDIIIVAGKNLFPEDIEDAVGSVPGVLPGRVVAFAADDARAGTETVGLIAETELVDEKLWADLKINIARAGMAIDVTIGQIHLAPPRWLVKSSSGKLARQTNRERLMSGALDSASRQP